MSYIRSGFRLAGFLLVQVLSCMTSAVLWLLFRGHPKTHCRWLGPASRFWARMACWTLGIHYRIEGDRHIPPGAMIISNHVGSPDILLLAACFEVFFVSKAEIGSWPVVGWTARMGKTIFVDRNRRHQVAAMTEGIQERLREGFSVAWFPEGGATPGDTILPFKSSAFEAAVRENKPVVPVLIRYHDDNQPSIACWRGITFAKHIMRILKAPRLDATVTVLPPVTGNNRHMLAYQCYEQLYREFHGRDPEPDTAKLDRIRDRTTS